MKIGLALQPAERGVDSVFRRGPEPPTGRVLIRSGCFDHLANPVRRQRLRTVRHEIVLP